MTSVVNDENQGPCSEAKHIDSVLDIFALDQPTGRPSILRQSENLPSKTVAKGVKVCFQTPRRDPVTKRIVSPSKTSKITTLDECTKAMESLQLHNTSTSPQEFTEPVDGPKIELTPNPDDMPIQSKGGYNFDFDNLDGINPFQASIKMPNSPTRPALEDIPAGIEVPQCGTPETVSGEIAQTETVLDDTLPITPSMENSLANMSTDIHSTDSSVVTVSKGMADNEQDSSSNITDEETPTAMSFTVIPEEATTNYSVEDAPLPPKGAYNLDFDNLDLVDPFMTGGSKIPNSPQVGKKVPCSEPPVKESVATDMESLNKVDLPATPVATVVSDTPKLTDELATAASDAPKPTEDGSAFQSTDAPLNEGPVKLDFNFDDGCNVKRKPPPKRFSKKTPALKSSEREPAPEKKEPTLPKESPVNPAADDVDMAPIPKSSYSLQLDKFDDPNFNPFGTKAKMNNSLTCEEKSNPVGKAPTPCSDPPVKESVATDMESLNKVDLPVTPVATVVSDTPKLTDEFVSQPAGAQLKAMEIINGVDMPEKPVATAASDAPKPTEDGSAFQSTDAPLNEGPVKLEFNFDDGCNVKRKPPPKKFSKKAPGLKSSEREPAPEKKEPTPLKESPVNPAADDVDMAPIPKSSYSLQLDKFDDPNFNPFGTKAKMNNSLTCEEKSSPVVKAPTPVEEIPSPVCTGDGKDDIQKTDGPTPVALKENNVTTIDEKTETSPGPDLGFQPETEQPVLSAPDVTLGHQYSQPGLPEPSEEFVPGTMFMANDFDGQMDYLEQFGTGSFKESALRKQSLYLKFDPLLKESPKKAVGPAGQNPMPRLAPFVSRLEAPQMAHTKAAQSREEDFKLVDLIAATVDPFVQNSEMHVCRVAPLPPPTNTEDAIVEMLKYSQKDMDQAIALIQMEANEKDKQWKAKYDKLFEECEDKKRIISELESSSAKMRSAQEKDRQKTETSLRKTLGEALQEKEQVQTELSNLERSFSEVLKRLDKYKEIIAGCRKNEEALKACAQDALARIKKEEQRYQTLKAHAEEKITLANKQIFEVRSKFKAEMAGLQAQLRMEQLKVQSLEKSLDQKGKEFEELSKVCDELISNVQRS